MTKASKKNPTVKRRAAEASRPRASDVSASDTERGSSPTKSTKTSGESGQGAKRKGHAPTPKDERRRCTAIANRSGERCKSPAIKGGTVCPRHGGNLPQVKKKAAERVEEARQQLLDMVEPALKELRTIVEDSATSNADKLKAINMVLNRTGLSERHLIDVVPHTPTPWDALADQGIDLDPDLSELDTGGGEAAHVVRRNNHRQLAQSAQDDIDRERYDEEAAEYANAPMFRAGVVVQGEVVEPPPPTQKEEGGSRKARVVTDSGPITYEGETEWTDPRTGSEHDPSPYRGPYDREPDSGPDDPPRYAR